MGFRWYVVQSKLNNEFYAEKELRQQGFIVYCPAYKEKIIKRQKTCTFTRPLYPTYLFVMFDVKDDKWGKVRNTRGVKGIIGSNETTALPLPEGFVENLINLSDQEGILELKPKNILGHNIVPGSFVRILAGNFNGLVARVFSVRKKRITIILPLLSRAVDVSLPLDLVELCTDQTLHPASAGVR